MKQIIKIFLIIILLAFNNSANACELKFLPFGKDYKTILDKYKISTEIYDKKNFELNIRGQKICRDLKNYQIAFIFIDGKFSSIRIENFEQAKFKLYNIIKENFGEPINKPNFEASQKNYANYIDNEDYYITYKNSESENQEIAIINSKKYLKKQTNFYQKISDFNERSEN